MPNVPCVSSWIRRRHLVLSALLLKVVTVLQSAKNAKIVCHTAVLRVPTQVVVRELPAVAQFAMTVLIRAQTVIRAERNARLMFNVPAVWTVVTTVTPR